MTTRSSRLRPGVAAGRASRTALPTSASRPVEVGEQVASDLLREARARSPASSREAPSTASGEPKCLSSARLRAGPMPGRSSMIDSVIALSRRIRWWVMAKRCASSRTRWSELQLGRVVRHHDRRRVAGQEDLLDPLGQRDDGHAAVAEALQRVQAGAELALAAVDDTRFGSAANDASRSASYGERSACLLPLGVAARQDLRHRGEIIAGVDLADREAPVIALLRRAALEDDHRRDGVRAADVRDVEALDPHRQRVQAERLLEAGQRVHALLAAALGLELLLVEREPRVALGEIEDAALAAALGGADLDRRRRAARPAAGRARPARSPRPSRPGRRSAAGSRARSRSTGA